MLSGPAIHAPPQQSGPVEHGAPTARHAPGPGSQVSVATLQIPQQSPPPPPSHASPVGRQLSSMRSVSHRPSLHSAAQHSALVLQSSLRSLQARAVEQTPATQEKEQQSAAAPQGVPNPLQKEIHCRSPSGPTGSQPPLQHSSRPVHAASGALQLADRTQTLATQMFEQQSLPVEQPPPNATHAGAASSGW